MKPAPPDGIQGLLEIMRGLRAPDGCPWDREQDHQSLRKYLIEEAYEVIEAIDKGDDSELCEELGDLLLQVVFHAQLAAERGVFDFSDVAQAIRDKMIRRHPHVFGEITVKDAAEVLKNWQAIKAGESETKRASALHGVPAALPALVRAQRLGDKAAQVGFDWPDTAGIWEKIREELAEIENAKAVSPAAVEAEMGDVLFALASLARHWGIDLEAALHRTLREFERRFAHMEAALQAEGKRPEAVSLAEKEALYQAAKRAGG